MILILKYHDVVRELLHFTLFHHYALEKLSHLNMCRKVITSLVEHLLKLVFTST